MSNKSTYGNLLKNPGYFKLLSAGVISTFGDSLDMIAFSWMAYELTGSAVALASIFAVNGLPAILFGLFAGVGVSYYEKKKTAALMDFLRGSLVIGTALLYFTGYLKPWHLFVITFLNSTLENFRNPAGTVLFTLIVKKDEYSHASGLSTSLQQLVSLFGLSSAGFLVGVLGIGNVIMIDGVTFFLSGMIILSLKVKEVLDKGNITLTNIRSDFHEGLSYFFKDKLILSLGIFAALIGFFLVPFNSLQPLYISDILRLGPEGLSYMGASFMIAMILSSLITPAFMDKFNHFVLLTLGGLGLGAAYFMLTKIAGGSYTARIIKLCAVMVLMGGSVPFMQIVIQTHFLNSVPPELLARTSSVLSAMAQSTSPLGGMVVALLSTCYSITRLFTLFSIFIGVLFLLQIFNVYLRRMGQNKDQEPL